MRVEKNIMVPLGYGKYFRSDSIIGLEPIEEDRGPGRRTWVYIEGQTEPMVGSRTELTILRDMTQMSEEVSHVREQRELLLDILDTVEEISPMLRHIVRDQGNWDLDRLEQRIEAVVREQNE
jgi:hypothetical protein